MFGAAQPFSYLRGQTMHMKQRIFLLLRTFLAFALASLAGKLVFCGFYAKLMEHPGVGDVVSILWHGLPHDFCVAGYLTALPALLLTISLFTGGRWLRRTWDVLIWAESLALATAICTNIGLYEYWRFPLDATPLFYFFSSPQDALASVSLWIVLAGLAGIGLLTFCFARILHGRLTAMPSQASATLRQRILRTLAMLVLTAALFIPIRGGFTVSTMNTGHVFFSPIQTRNHAAVAPLFSLLESLGKQTDFRAQYRFFDDAEAHAIFQALHMPTDSIRADAGTPLLAREKPDVVLVILESFSSKLMRTLGGETDVTPCLERIAEEGLLFTNFYANSFRTDRGLVAILSGYPAQPTTSVMKYPQKTANLPSLARSLGTLGYSASYFYGGDADFTNMRSYLINQGFSEITEDTDFPIGERLSKWGVHDHLLFQRALEDIHAKPYDAQRPRLRVIQTSSSHEPFEVPYKRLENERLNAFAYTDSCLGSFVSGLQADEKAWNNTLVIIVPDHLGAYPTDIDNLSTDRYRIPLIFTGGALARKGRIPTVGSQIDISFTLLNALASTQRTSAPLKQPRSGGHFSASRDREAGNPLAQEFPFGKDLLDPQAPHFAFFTFPDAMGYADAQTAVIYDNQAGRAVVTRGRDTDLALRRAKAYLQCLYDDLSSR